MNVRLQLSQTLALLFDKYGNRAKEGRLTSEPKLINMVKRLRTDSNKDTKYFLRYIQLPDDETNPE